MTHKERMKPLEQVCAHKINDAIEAARAAGNTAFLGALGTMIQRIENEELNAD